LYTILLYVLKLSIKRQQLSVVINVSIQTVTVAEANWGEVYAMSEQDQPEPTAVPTIFGE